jgi:putative phage-type endonuclease
MLTQAQREQRRSGIGGSEIAAILGRSPHASAIDVWARKVGAVVDEPPPSPEIEAGNIWEGPLRQFYAERYGCTVLVPGQVAHPVHPWAFASPDGVVEGASPRGVEIKAVSSWVKDQWTDEPPLHYQLQCQWYAGVCTIPTWHVSALFRPANEDIATLRRLHRLGGDDELLALLHEVRADVREYVVHYDPELGRLLFDAAGEFWEKHVVTGDPPPPDGSVHYRRHLERKFPQHVERVIATTREQDELVAKYREARLQAAEAEQQAEQLKQRLQLEMADAAVLDSVHGRITWRRCKDSTGTDWYRVAQELAPLAGVGASELDALAARFRSVTKAGARRFIVPRAWSREAPEE